MESEEPLLVWERPEPPGRPAPTPLSRESIVRAAVDLADRDGIGAVSLRKIGSALGAGPMRLYGYVAGKDELLDLMIDKVYGEIVPAGTTAGGDWRAAVHALARALRGAAHRHEWFVDLLGSRPHVGGPHALAYLERTLSAVDSAPGLDDLGTVMEAVRAINAYVVGAIRTEVTEVRAERATGMTLEQWQASTGAYLRRATATGRFPMLAKLITIPTAEPDPGTAFGTGLDCLLDGIANRYLPVTPLLEYALDGAEDAARPEPAEPAPTD